MTPAEQEKKTTEQKIMEAARKIFLAKGMDGARMQEIADEAGINKALLHYYFRSKEKLFTAIFEEAMGTFLPKVGTMIQNPEISVFTKIELFIEHYITLLQANPFIPAFVVIEINRNPENIMFNFLTEGSKAIFGFIKNVAIEIEKGTIKPIKPEQLITNMLSLCLFPFIAKPMLMKTIFMGNEQLFNQFVEDRKKEVPKFIIDSIKNN